MAASKSASSGSASGSGTQCRTCSKVVPAKGLRRGLCRACYLRDWRGAALPATVAEGAHCFICPERRRTLLRWTRLGVGRVVTCHNCGFLVDHARPRPSTEAEVRELFERERRAADRRKSYVIDSDDPAERRRVVRRRRRRVSV